MDLPRTSRRADLLESFYDQMGYQSRILAATKGDHPWAAINVILIEMHQLVGNGANGRAVSVWRLTPSRARTLMGGRPPLPGDGP